MGGFGVINLKKLSAYKQSFGFYAEQLAYPEKTTFSDMEVKGDFLPSISELIEAYWQKMQQLSLDDIQENYVQTFDFQKKSTLYMTYVKFEDSRERGRMLEQMKSMYEIYGLEIENSELPDYLPLMCEFLYAANWYHETMEVEAINMFLAVMEDGTFELLKALEKFDSPYAYIVKAIRLTFKHCLQQEEIAHA